MQYNGTKISKHMNKVKIMNHVPLVPKITRNVYREMNERIITLGESTVSVL